MLPEQLSSNLCSLQPGEDRLAFSSVFKMSPDGRVLSSWFGKSVIKSAAKLSYNMAQQAIDQGKLPEDLTTHDDHDMEGIVEDIKQLDVGSIYAYYHETISDKLSSIGNGQTNARSTIREWCTPH